MSSTIFAVGELIFFFLSLCVLMSTSASLSTIHFNSISNLPDFSSFSHNTVTLLVLLCVLIIHFLPFFLLLPSRLLSQFSRVLELVFPHVGCSIIFVCSRVLFRKYKSRLFYSTNTRSPLHANKNKQYTSARSF